MLTYTEAKELLNTARNKANGKPIANNTRLFDRGEYIAVRLHSTDVLNIYPNGKYKVYTGGYYSTTTKERINRFSPVRVYQQSWAWYTWQPALPDEPSELFIDGAFYNSDGVKL